MSNGRWAAESDIRVLAELEVRADDMAEAAAVCENGNAAWTCSRVARVQCSSIVTGVEHDEGLVEELEDNSMARVRADAGKHHPSRCLPPEHGHRKASYGLEVIQHQLSWSAAGAEASWRRHQRFLCLV